MKKTVMITGATDGIGKALAMALYKDYNLALCGRSEDKMKELIKELGDVAWYLAETAFALDVELEEVLMRNIEKLKKRYPEGFSTEKSINRE